MIRFKVDLLDDLESLRSFDSKLSAASQVALDKSAAAILNKLRASFLAESDPEGVKWLPSRAGIRRRAKGGSGTLFNTGRLFRSIQLFSPSPGIREIGTDVDYGRKHQLGEEGMVKRVFLGFTDAHSDLANAIFLNEIKKLVES